MDIIINPTKSAIDSAWTIRLDAQTVRKLLNNVAGEWPSRPILPDAPTCDYFFEWIVKQPHMVNKGRWNHVIFQGKREMLNADFKYPIGQILQVSEPIAEFIPKSYKDHLFVEMSYESDGAIRMIDEAAANHMIDEKETKWTAPSVSRLWLRVMGCEPVCKDAKSEEDRPFMDDL